LRRKLSMKFGRNVSLWILVMAFLCGTGASGGAPISEGYDAGSDGNTEVRGDAGEPIGRTNLVKAAVSEDKITLKPVKVYVTKGIPVPLNVKIDADFDNSVMTIGRGKPLDSTVQTVSWNNLTLESGIRGQIDITGTPQSAGSESFRVFTKSSAESSTVTASADFTVYVTEGGVLSLTPSSVTLPSDESADKVVDVKLNDPSLTLENLTITQAGGERTSFYWRDLVIAADVKNSRVTIKGKPNVMSDSAVFTVNGTSSKGELRGADLTVTITAPEFYGLQLVPSALHPIVKKEYDKIARVHLASNESKSPTLTNVTIDGQSTVSWNGLTLFIDDNKNISVSGVADKEATRTFTIEGTVTGKVVLPARLTVTVHPVEEESREKGNFINAAGEIRVERDKTTSIKLTCSSPVTIDSVIEIDPDGKWEWVHGSAIKNVSAFYVSVRPTVTGMHTLRIRYSLGETAYYQDIGYRSVHTGEKDPGSSGCALGTVSGVGLALAALWVGGKNKKL
jgi:hypothetical protein